ncbi:MAG: glycosyltransferase family 2 protein [Parvularculaceae bacterium]
MNSHYRLSIVMVNYRTPALVEASLAALTPMLAPAGACVVVVDNASGDGSYERLAAWTPPAEAEGRVLILKAERNGGFSYGNNLGAAAIASDYVFFLNSDATPRPGALTALLAAAEENPDAGLITPTIVGSDGIAQVSRFRRHSLISEFVDGAQTGPITRLFPQGEVPIFPDDETSAPDWVSFAAVLLRRDAMEKAGPMDEGFFLYYEDCDYCRRITDAGYAVARAPGAVIEHDAGGSTKLREKSERGARLPAYYYRSRARYFRKYYGAFGPVLANVAWAAGRAVALMRGLVGRPAPRLNEGRLADMWIGWRGERTPDADA